MHIIMISPQLNSQYVLGSAETDFIWDAKIYASISRSLSQEIRMQKWKNYIKVMLRLSQK